MMHGNYNMKYLTMPSALKNILSYRISEFHFCEHAPFRSIM